MKRFYKTGSRVYGKPREDSDIDILADGTEVTEASLVRHGYVESDRDSQGELVKLAADGLRDGWFRRFRKGKRDVVLCKHEEALEERLRARSVCICEMPAERPRCVAIHRENENAILLPSGFAEADLEDPVTCEIMADYWEENSKPHRAALLRRLSANLAAEQLLAADT